MKKLFMILAVFFASHFLSAESALCFNKDAFNVNQNVSFEKFSYGNNKTLSEELFDLIFELLWLENYCVFYDDYPFKNGDFIVYSTSQSHTSARPYHYEIETGLYYFPRVNFLGNESRLEGTIWHFFGLIAENQISKNLPDDEMTGLFKLGGTYHLFQTNPLSMSFYIQWARIYKPVQDNGFCIGLIIKSYIARRILLEFRCSISDFENGDEDNEGYEYDRDSVGECHLEAGFMFSSRFELYAAWKVIQDGFAQTKESGVAAGVKCHF
ncbi:MAG: hypothetical protein J6Z17_04030 [Treponema sp.]|nr:hypothetical protein [Treponema sp.]